MPIPERLLWSYITQIANALKAIHTSGLAARNMDPSKVLITGKNRYVVVVTGGSRTDRQCTIKRMRYPRCSGT